MYLEILGPLRVTGWPEVPARSVPVLDLAVYLALHPDRPYTAEDLRDPLSIGKQRALEADTICTYAGNLRRTIDATHLPDGGRAGYRLAAFDSDWNHFQALTTSPTRHPDGGADRDAAEVAGALVEALSLVRGAPFGDLPATGFGWVATELLVSHTEAKVIAAACRLADLALTAGDWRLASWAAERGLVVSPTGHDLNAAALRAAHASGEADRLAQAWRDVLHRFAAATDSGDQLPVPPDLADLHRQLQTPSADHQSRSGPPGSAGRPHRPATRPGPGATR